ncbi:HK97 gp10 family phage protein [Pseudomonas juntendi]|uniref:HK97 gp10 family phage protein n=1 Tax=Pseudomonas juntendi TaxID=2666183 RepID=UPI0021B46808|nr:HK97 gp10 family phage protein [Pseudomonas juntendi]UXA36812.1 HK97 gp10 family phage protein [Pseudomonas juntendi]
MTKGRGWSTPPSAFAGVVEDALTQRSRAIAMAMLGEIVLRSPVGNPDLWKSPPPPGYSGGRFRGSHIVSIGAPVYTQTTKIDKVGSETIAEGQRQLSGLEPFTVIYIQTNLPYAEKLEDGHSTQAPGGVYAVSFNGVSQAYS